MAKRRTKKIGKKYVKRIAVKNVVRYSTSYNYGLSRRHTKDGQRKSRRGPTVLRGKTQRKGGQTQNSYVNVGKKLVGPILKPDNPCTRERQKIRRAYFSFKNSMPRGVKLNKGGSGRFDNKVC